MSDRFDLLCGYVDLTLFRDMVERHSVSHPIALRWMAVAFLAGLIAAAPRPAAARTGAPTPTPACPAIILGYYPCWNEDYRADKIPYHLLTHVFHAFLQPQADGTLLAPAGPPPYLEPELIANAHAAGVRVIASVGGWDEAADANFRAIAASASLRSAFAGNLEAFCRAYGYDGVDLDWESPRDAADRANQTLMVRAIRETFSAASSPAPSWSLTMAVGGSDWSGRWNDYAALDEYISFYNLMAYDGHGDWSGHMGHNEPLEPGGDPYDDVSVHASVDYLAVARAVPPAKIVLGLPFYGYRWPTVETLYEACSPCHAYQEDYHAIAPLIGAGWTTRWDSAASVPYLTRDDGEGVISYDDGLSIAAKVDYGIAGRGLGGVFAWEISADCADGRQPLLEAMHGAVLGACGLSPTPTPSMRWHIAESGDYDGDGTSDLAVFRPSRGGWMVREITRDCFGSSSDIPLCGDYNGDGTTEYGFFRPSVCLWAIKNVTCRHFGTAADIVVSGDYDGDGACELGIFRGSSGLWSIAGMTRVCFGSAGDLPIPGSYGTGDRKEIAIFRGSSGMWAVRYLTRFYFGSSSDDLVPGDYSGAGKWEAAISRPTSGLWSIRHVTRIYLGGTGDWARPGDYDGDGVDDAAIFRESAGMWSVRNLSRVYFGATGDIPVTR